MAGNKLLFIYIIIHAIIESCGFIEVNANKHATTRLTAQDSIIFYVIKKNSEIQCSEWNVPSKGKILPLLNELVEVSAQEWNNCYGDWTCGVEGELLLKGETYYYRIDAGGWIILNSHGNQRYYVCKDKHACWSKFPSECFCDQDGIIKQ